MDSTSVWTLPPTEFDSEISLQHVILPNPINRIVNVVIIVTTIIIKTINIIINSTILQLCVSISLLLLFLSYFLYFHTFNFTYIDHN